MVSPFGFFHCFYCLIIDYLNAFGRSQVIRFEHFFLQFLLSWFIMSLCNETIYTHVICIRICWLLCIFIFWTPWQPLIRSNCYNYFALILVFRKYDIYIVELRKIHSYARCNAHNTGTSRRPCMWSSGWKSRFYIHNINKNLQIQLKTIHMKVCETMVNLQARHI